MSDEISDRVKAMYRRVRECGLTPEELCLADALRDTLALAMKAEFYGDHELLDGNETYCASCIQSNETDPRHKWEFTDWQQAAHKILMGESNG